MADFVLSCCSTADLSEEHFRERDISYICFHYSLDGKQYEDDLGRSLSFEEFYRAMAGGADTRTSQVNVNEYAAYFTSLLEKGKDVLHVCLSSGISGSYNSAVQAARELSDKFPGRTLIVVDGLGASSGYGLFMDKLADLRDSGMSITGLHAWALEHRLHLHHWFYSTDLTFYVKGGRISKASGWFGTVLKICPLLNMDDLGRLIPRYKLRGRNRVMAAALEQMEAHAEGGLDYSGKCYISNSGCYADARALADMVEARFTKLAGPVEIYSVGTTIGSHTGPGTVALFFWGDERVR